MKKILTAIGIKAVYEAIYCKYVEPFFARVRKYVQDKIGRRRNRDDYITELLVNLTSRESHRRKIFRSLYRIEGNNCIKLSILVAAIRHQRNLRKLVKIFQTISNGLHIDRIVKCFHIGQLENWIKTLCYFCKVRDGDKKFKRRNPLNFMLMRHHALLLLEFGIKDLLRRIANSDMAAESIKEQLFCRIVQTMTEAMKLLPVRRPELFQDELTRIFQRFVALLKHNDLTNPDLRKEVTAFIKEIPLAFKMALYHPGVNTLSLLRNCCGTSTSSDSEFYGIWQQMARYSRESACDFIGKVIDNSIATPEYLNVLKSDPEKAKEIARSFQCLIDRCCSECIENKSKLCKGSARYMLSDWIHENNRSLEKHDSVNESLSMAIIAMRNEKRLYLKRDRIAIDKQGEVISSENHIFAGIVKNVDQTTVLFKTDLKTADSLEKVHGDLQFKIKDILIRKPIANTVRYEDRGIRKSKKSKYSILAVKLATNLSPDELKTCRDLVRDTSA